MTPLSPSHYPNTGSSLCHNVYRCSTYTPLLYTSRFGRAHDGHHGGGPAFSTTLRRDYHNYDDCILSTSDHDLHDADKSVVRSGNRGGSIVGDYFGSDPRPRSTNHPCTPKSSRFTPGKLRDSAFPKTIDVDDSDEWDPSDEALVLQQWDLYRLFAYPATRYGDSALHRYRPLLNASRSSHSNNQSSRASSCTNPKHNKQYHNLDSTNDVDNHSYTALLSQPSRSSRSGKHSNHNNALADPEEQLNRIELRHRSGTDAGSEIGLEILDSYRPPGSRNTKSGH